MRILQIKRMATGVLAPALALGCSILSPSRDGMLHVATVSYAHKGVP